MSSSSSPHVHDPAASGPPPTASPAGPHARSVAWLPRVLWVLAGIFLVSGAAPLVLSAYLVRHLDGKTLPGLHLGTVPIGTLPLATLPAQLAPIAQKILQQRVRLRLADEVITVTWQELGIVLDEAALAEQITAVGHAGSVLTNLRTYLHARRNPTVLLPPLSLDEKRALDYLMTLKDQLDRAPVDARLDLEKHTIAEEKKGMLLNVYPAMVALQYGVRSLQSGQALDELNLPIATTEPTVRRTDLQDLDVSSVLGSWETHYSNASVDSDRTYNLKIGASKLNGHMVKPHEVFSFNGAVGDRTEKEGYRVAPVISAGELIDGLAGGMCQIASTLHAAAFFAGLDIIRSTPHSRPSTYIPMGLDSTVVYPDVDLKLRNPYDFPVVLHYVVNQGSVKVEILGKKVDQHVAFEREILTESPFASVTRTDPEMPVTQKFTDQDGYPGYRIKRRRYVYTGKWRTDGKTPSRGRPEGLLSLREWELSYPSTTQYLRVGSGPPKTKKKEPPPSHRIPALPAWAKPVFVIQR